MLYDEIYGYGCLLSEEDRKNLCENNAEFVEISSIIRDYEKCVWLQKKYFCRQEWINEEDPEFREAYYVYDSKLADENKKFMSQWPEKKEKLAARLKKNRFLTSGGRKRVEDDLKYGEVMFGELSDFYATNEKFNKLEEILKANGARSLSGNILGDHIREMYKKRQQIVEAFMQEKEQNAVQPE
ncbi:MAG: hypothetical protein IJ310_03255 [Clostridia bacterium]|nr:hypothetical protein [Clostridia bacterium]